MAELVDARGLGPRGVKTVGVRIPPLAPGWQQSVRSDLLQEESNLKTEVTKGEGHQVVMKVEADSKDIEPLLDRAYRDIGRDIKVPGFRKGKVPRRVIDTHVGAERVRAEAIKEGMPILYMMSVGEAGIFPVSEPEIEILSMDQDGSVVFEVKVDVKPEIEVRDYVGLEVDPPDTEVKEEDVQRALDEARDRFATLEVVDGRPVEKGDYVIFDYKMFAEGIGEEESGGSDRMVEIGAEDFLPGFDDQLAGARKGDILDVAVTLPIDFEIEQLSGKPATFRTIVKEIKRKVLPPLDDDLAKEVSRFDTIEEFEQDLRERLAELKRSAGERALRARVVDELVSRTYIDLPESMVDEQIQREIHEMSHELEDRGISLDEYLERTKGSRYQLEKALKDQVVERLKSELVVDAVASAEDIEVTDEEAEAELRQAFQDSGGDADKLVEQAKKLGRLGSAKASMRLSKAVDFLVEKAELKGEPPGAGVVATGIEPGEGGAPQEEEPQEEKPEEEVAGEAVEEETPKESGLE